LWIILCMSFNGVAQNVFDASRNGDMVALSQIWKSEPSQLNAINDEGYSPLVLAAYHDQYEAVQFLLQHKASPNTTSKHGSPLMAATVKGNLEIISLLLNYKADPNLIDPNGTTALHYASMFKLNEIAAQLLVFKADPNLKDNRGNSSADYAKLTNNEMLINLLKQHQ